MNDKKEEITVCKRCGRTLTKEDLIASGGLPYCNQCRIELAQQYIDKKDMKDKKVTKQVSKHTKVIDALKWVALSFFSVLIIINSIVLIRIFIHNKEVEFTPPELSKDAIMCMANLGEISELLKAGELPPDTIICPVSGKPYIVRIVEGDTIVSCPNPELHHLKNLWVSAKHPKPEVEK
ncbi:MAG: hypothetical protein B5M53_02285 [Candidatus Cloacimonas sp. 4484_209]|nr:MAG: hypothetical protein B5M53_02285 [Candidatus Cloacimonas sp. 4484_209]